FESGGCALLIDTVPDPRQTTERPAVLVVVVLLEPLARNGERGVDRGEIVGGAGADRDRFECGAAGVESGRALLADAGVSVARADTQAFRCHAFEESVACSFDRRAIVHASDYRSTERPA